MTPRTDRRHVHRRSNDRLWDFVQRGALGLLVVLYLIGFVSQGNRTDDNCARLHAIVKVGGEIIGGGKGDLAKFRDEGTITQEQYERGVAAVDTRLAQWNSADCPTPKRPPDPTP